MKYDLKILQEYVNKKLLNVQVHPTLPLRIYKYTQECVFSRKWDEITLNMRGTVIDNEGNRVSNPFPKFFNLDELEPLNISLPNLPYKVYEKIDGSLIEVFKYGGEIVVSSAGSFTSAQATVAENMLKTKYSHLLKYIKEGKTYLFELIFPLNKILVDYGKTEKLVLLAIRDLETGNEIEIDMINARAAGFDVVEEVNMSIEELKKEIETPYFFNKEGFVIVFKNGFRVKMKYAEYFRLHKLLCNINEKFIWEHVSEGKEINLNDIPDESFEFIKNTTTMLKNKFNEIENEIKNIYEKIHENLDNKHGKNNWTRKDFANAILPTYKKFSGPLFNLFDKKYDTFEKAIWKMLEPKYEKGFSGFQSMKIPN